MTPNIDQMKGNLNYKHLQIWINLSSFKYNLNDEQIKYIAVDCANHSFDALNTVMLLVQKNPSYIPDNIINAVSLNLASSDIIAWRAVQILLYLGNLENECALDILNTTSSEVTRIIDIKMASQLAHHIHNDIIDPYKKSNNCVIRNIVNKY
jgi:hypothetical protein